MASKVTQVPFAPLHDKLAHPESDHNLADIAGAPEHQIKAGNIQGYGLDGRGNPRPSHNPSKMTGSPKRIKSLQMRGKPLPSLKNNGGAGAGSSGYDAGDGIA